MRQPRKAPNTHHTLDRNIFSKTCCRDPKVRPMNHPSCSPRKRVGAGSLGLPIAPPHCKKGLCATRGHQSGGSVKQGWVEPHPQSALASATTCSAVAGVAAVYTTATASQCGWRVGSDLPPSCLTTCNGLLSCMNSIHKTPWDFCPLPDFALPH